MFPATAGGEKGAPVPYEGDQTLISLTRFIKAHATVRRPPQGCCGACVAGGLFRAAGNGGGGS